MKPAPSISLKKVTVSADSPVIFEKTPIVPIRRAERRAAIIPFTFIVEVDPGFIRNILWVVRRGKNSLP